MHFLKQFMAVVEAGIAGIVAMLEYNMHIGVAGQQLYLNGVAVRHRTTWARGPVLAWWRGRR
jgi:hypothetical protein